MASIRRRGSRWQVQVRRKGRPAISRSFTLKADALEWARHMEREADRRGLTVDRRVLESQTLGDLVERYRDTVVPNKRGRDRETCMLNAFLRHPVTRLPLSELTGEHFASYRDQRMTTVKPATINRELGLLQHMFEVARDEWSIPLPDNPLRKVRKPRPDRPRERRLEEGEFDRLIRACSVCRDISASIAFIGTISTPRSILSCI